jgi:uncharacterized protein (TIGR01319 family)
VNLVVCVDFGSTFTKALLVDLDGAEVVASASARTTVDTDVLDGWVRCRDQLAAVEPATSGAPVLGCSSAGGGLRIAVIGNEELVTAEAGRRVALSSGGRVVHVGADGLDAERLGELRASRPDLVLLVGGTDGGNAEVVVSAAGALAAARWPGPVVLAGNAQAAAEAGSALRSGGVAHAVAANVVPRIGVLEPQPARLAIREAFLRHVIGGKHLSASAEFARMVTGPTPDVVLTGVELLASVSGDVAVVDVGGATTDVHSVVEVDPEDAGLARQVVAPTSVTRTVEGDLGMRWSAVPTVQQGVEAGLVSTDEEPALWLAAEARHDDPGLVPADENGRRSDLRLAAVATGVALRRHAGRQRVVLGADGRVVERTGTDLREVTLLVGSGGVLRHAPPEAARRVLAASTGADLPGGWLLPRAPRLVVDRAYVLVAAGLLAADHPAVARSLLTASLGEPHGRPGGREGRMRA